MPVDETTNPEQKIFSSFLSNSKGIVQIKTTPKIPKIAPKIKYDQAKKLMSDAIPKVRGRYIQNLKILILYIISIKHAKF